MGEVFVFPDPFCGCGVEEENSVEESPDAAGCGFYLDGAGLDEVSGTGLEAELSENIWKGKKGSYSIFERFGVLLCMDLLWVVG